MQPNKPLMIGLVGGIASGKSFVAEQFERLGAAKVSADVWAHEVLKLDEVKQALRDRWGAGVFDEEGAVDRRAVAQKVFAPPPEGPRELAFLEALTHPRIGEQLRRQLETLALQGSTKAIVLDVPLLAEGGWRALCDRIVYVDAPRELRLARALERGWTREDFERREALQESLETKRKLADVVIDSSGRGESVSAQVERFWRTLHDPSPQ